MTGCGCKGGGGNTTPGPGTNGSLNPEDFAPEVQVQVVDSRFRGGSSVGSLDIPIPLPGPAEFWHQNESATDDVNVKGTIEVAAGQTVTFTAMGTFTGSATQQDITDQVTWSSSNSAVITTITNGSGAVLSTATSGATTTVTATLNGITSGPLTITVQ